MKEEAINKKECKILLVDNDEGFCEIFKGALSEIFYIDDVTTRKAALEKASQEIYDLFILDLHLKTRIGDTVEPDGLQLRKELKKKYPEVGIFIITEDDRDGTRQLFADQDTDHFEYKQFLDYKNLSSKIDFYLQKKNKAKVFDVFLSHSRKDKEFVNVISKKLKQENISVWKDVDQIKAGDFLKEKISQGINNSLYFVVVVSKNSIRATWVKTEIKIMLTQIMENKKIKIISVKYDDCNNPKILRDWESKNKDEILYVDFSAYKSEILETYFNRSKNKNINFDNAEQKFKESFGELLKGIS